MNRIEVAGVVLGLGLLAILLVGAAPGRAATTGTTYNSVQVFVQTGNSSFTGSYSVTAFNSSGYPLVTYDTPYPAASFELPSGSYIFTASATPRHQSQCVIGVSAGAATTAEATSTGSSGGTEIIGYPPCLSIYPQSEYGFVTQKVDGPTTLSISTQPVDNLATTTVTVHVTYVNGTAAAGTQVYASILGGEWYGGYGASPDSGSGALSMSGVVGSDGNAKLLVPVAPIEVTAWNWIPVNVPVTPSSENVIVGGEKVNVTLNWQPSYIGLAGSVLIVPPQTTGSIVLHVQQQNYWATPLGVQTASSGVSAGTAVTNSASSGPAAIPASLAAQQGTPQSQVQTVTQTSTLIQDLQVSQPSSTSTGSAGYETILLTVVGALALGIASASLIIVRRKSDV